MKKINLLIAIVLLSSLQFSFKPGMNEQQMLTWSNKYFSTSFDPSAEIKLKKWDLVLTEDAFIRLKKTYQNGKQEYYSFQLRRFTDMNYLGTTAGGILQLKTKADDIIVQTYDDPKGDIDSMATQLNLPVKNVQPEQLDSLMAALNYFKGKTL